MTITTTFIAESGLAWTRLTRRQQQIMRLRARGLIAKEVGRILGISPRTVETIAALGAEELALVGDPRLVTLAALGMLREGEI